MSDSYGPSLTPPARVEKTTVYGPALSTESTDQLSRRRELGLAPVELTVELAAPQLREDLADLRRLADSELREIGAATSSLTSRSRSRYSRRGSWSASASA